MSFTRAGQLVRHSPIALLETPLGLVAENLRESHYSTIPVLDSLPPDPEDLRPTTTYPRILGLLDERDLSRAALPAFEGAATRHMATVGVSEAGDADNVFPIPDAFASSNGTLNGVAATNGTHPHGFATNGYAVNGHATEGQSAEPLAAPELLGTQSLRDLNARDIMRTDWAFIPYEFSLRNALHTLDNHDALALPVLDASGGYRGMISRSDIVAALSGQVRPPVVGGMATPLGVWLTTGTLSAGAPALGLALSGAMMGAMLMGVRILLTVIFTLIKPEYGSLYYSGRLGYESGGGTPLNLLVTVIELFTFLSFMRLVPLAGTHAAEHQTVHAIERGLPLTPEIVKTMPRAHPRCGTNLVALGAMIQIIFQHLPNIDAGTTVIALLFVFFAWRSFGTALQVFFTTRPASPKQLASGIKAGRDLLEKYQAQPHLLAPMPARLLNSGILLSGLGMAAVLIAGEQILTFAAQSLLHLSYSP